VRYALIIEFDAGDAEVDLYAEASAEIAAMVRATATVST
jgi:hypothetical protein